jgi:hypothetical protein
MTKQWNAIRHAACNNSIVKLQGTWLQTAGGGAQSTNQ